MTTVANDNRWQQQPVLEAEVSKQSSKARRPKLRPRKRHGAFWTVRFLNVWQLQSVCAGRVVSFEGVLSCHTFPMAPTVH